MRSKALLVSSGKASVCIGVRRCGKSTLLLQYFESLRQSGIEPSQFLIINFFDDRLSYMKVEHFQQILDAYFKLYQENFDKKIYCLFDEIQEIEGWEAFVDLLLRERKFEVFITGSSAKLLSTEIGTRMRGRSIPTELFPFSFLEFLAFKQIPVEKVLSNQSRLKVETSFEDYLKIGGFPEVLGKVDQVRVAIHQEYFHSILFRDIIERYNVQNPKALIDLALTLINNISSFYSINKIVGHLKQQGYKTSKETVGNYLSWFEDAFLLFSVSIYNASEKKG